MYTNVKHLTEQEAAKLYGYSRSWFQRRRVYGGAPPLSERSVTQLGIRLTNSRNGSSRSAYRPIQRRGQVTNN